MAETPDINVDELRRRARRRLLGAIVLALAAAVFVPMLLESDPKPLGEDVSVRIPPEDNAKFVNRLSDKGAKTGAKDVAAKSETAKEPVPVEPAPAPPVTAPTESAPSSTNMPAPKKSITQAEQKVLGAPAKSAAAIAAAPAPAPVAAPAAQPTTASVATSAPADAPKEVFSVQLAAFADDKGANALANKLKRADYPAYTEPLTTSKGTLWRVRVGPYPSRDAAIEVRDRLKGEGYSGIVAAAK
jgi:DedD protein